jgi:hypothetical protein
MAVPSRSKEYRVGITSPNTDLCAPSVSSFAIIRGNAASEDDVPRTISSSSLMYLRNRQMLKPCNLAMLSLNWGTCATAGRDERHPKQNELPRIYHETHENLPRKFQKMEEPIIGKLN